MALEPRTVTLEDAPNPELVDASRRFWISLPLAAVVLSLAMSGALPHLTWIPLVLASPVVWGGCPSSSAPRRR